MSIGRRIKEKNGKKICPDCGEKLELRKDIPRDPKIKRMGSVGYSMYLCKNCEFKQ